MWSYHPIPHSWYADETPLPSSQDPCTFVRIAMTIIYCILKPSFIFQPYKYSELYGQHMYFVLTIIQIE